MKDHDPQLKEVPTAREQAIQEAVRKSKLPSTKRILGWIARRDCKKCKGNGFYDVELRHTAVIMVANSFPKYEMPVELRVVCKCVELE